MSISPPLDLPQLLSWLQEDGLLDAKQAAQVCTHAAALPSAPLHPLCSVADCKLPSLTLDSLCAWLARRSHLPYLRIDPLSIDFSQVANVMTASYAARFNILPVESTHERIVIATAQPYALAWQAGLGSLAPRKLSLVIANPVHIADYIAQFFSLAGSVQVARQASTQDVALRHNFEQLVELGRNKSSLDANDQHVVRIVDWLWQYAFAQRASDIHLEPKRDAGYVRLRIDGLLHQAYQVPPVVMLAMTARIKLLGRMDVVEKRRPQDGRIKTRNAQGQEIELRLSTLPTAFGEKLVMRIFDPEIAIKSLAELGFPPVDAGRWRQLTAHTHGIVLVTGPTGSGKTTTLYSTLKALASSEVNVCTVEDPIEMVEPAFNQMQVQTQAGMDLSFADGVRALMRQDPDIIMVGEIRDLATAEMAIQAALTGHLVLSTLHTNDAPSAVMRLLELGVPAYLLEACLIGVLAQRLLRCLCSDCKQPEPTPTVAQWQQLTGGQIERPETTFRPIGCPLCRQSGYRGRAGIYELLSVTERFTQLIKGGADLHALRRQGMLDGMTPLRIAGARKIIDGTTSISEVLKITAALQD
ncbi:MULTISPECIES: GspE/PulE family protein [unclassified Janthinobacterium]|uniref:GspE/PulE family protein n=1 Tax=unclassified Janthinobacterium TaxID=2610881 RepID=UPI00161DFFDF|nr:MULTISPECIES: GspE/PulE family protein [unclassified Janthinobacterium]MBB5367603.1 general secretion pathway protein E [Janthinobacterium sp. K2C7]MBB5379919.1 general secretion pathway protein E [Janthinobacterium sp. K2Li3]MBB5385985.1 general secretion pathway protein E [Janthinobacterium sp. K2E3]